MTSTNSPVIIAFFFDGEPPFRVLSNFAYSPFKLDDILYNSVEAFWQSLKTEIPALRQEIYTMWGLPAKQAGRLVQQQGTSLFTYVGNIYKIGSEQHHTLLERALRAKFGQHTDSKNALLATGNRPLKHVIKNKFGQFRPGDSPALPAIVFERMLLKIREELQDNTFNETIEIPKGLNEF
jgi:predicted NAD-dependent protein-ADP-ribosyltransferase YbiA (DUF1768 family)